MMWRGNSSELKKSTQGIALVVTLGFLALLVIIVLGYSVMMRTERLASKSFNDMARTRHMLKAALARCMADINETTTNPALLYYPPWNALASLPGGPVVGNPPLMQGEVARFFPLSMTAFASNAASTVGWTNIFDPVDGQLIGRYSYVVVNCSGLLDANYIGRTNKTVVGSNTYMRAYGTNVGEIATANYDLPEFNVSALTAFPTNRAKKWTRFESMYDLDNIAYASCFSTKPSNTFIYSRAPAGVWSGTAIVQPVYIGGSGGTSSWNNADIQTAFTSAGVPSPAASLQNLMDYVDGNDLPNNTTNFCTEAFPMINEIIMTCRYFFDGANFTNIVRPEVEVWFPFVGSANAKSYFLIIAATFSNASPPSWNPSNIGSPGLGQYGDTYTFVPGMPWTQKVYMTTAAAPGPLKTAGISSTNPIVSFAAYEATVTAILREGGAGGTPVDEVRNLKIPLNFLPVAPGAAVNGGKAVNDPRFNYDTSQWVKVDGTVAPLTSPGAVNAGVCLPAAAGADGVSTMFVRNGPLANTGELGMMVYDPTAPWRTIKLLKGTVPTLPVLSYFTVNSNSVWRGNFNPNSLQRDALAAVIMNALPNRMPSDTPTAVTLAEAKQVADTIIAERNLAGPFANVGDLSRVSESAPTWPVGYDSLQKEGIIRNTSDLLATRQNMFMAVLAAQSVRDANSNRVFDVGEDMGEQRAVATLWRDPFPKTGRHEMYVRFYKMLPE